MSNNAITDGDRSMTRTYITALVLEIALITLLWVLGRVYGSR